MDTERIARVFEDHYPGLCRFVAGMVGDGSSAEDVAQEVFVRLLRVGVDAIREGEERFWIYRVGRNLALNEIDRRGVRRRALERLPFLVPVRSSRTPDEEAENRESQEQIARRIRDLPETRRTAFLLRELGGLSYREIALVMGASEGKVKVELFRARESLRTAAERSARTDSR